MTSFFVFFVSFVVHSFCASSSWLVGPEPVAGEVDEHVFQRRLAERDRVDAVGKGLDEPRDPLVAVRLLEPHGAVDDHWPAR